jgi:hypothetical protein
MRIACLRSCVHVYFCGSGRGRVPVANHNADNPHHPHHPHHPNHPNKACSRRSLSGRPCLHHPTARPSTPSQVCGRLFVLPFIRVIRVSWVTCGSLSVGSWPRTALHSLDRRRRRCLHRLANSLGLLRRDPPIPPSSFPTSATPRRQCTAAAFRRWPRAGRYLDIYVLKSALTLTLYACPPLFSDAGAHSRFSRRPCVGSGKGYA